MPDRPVHYLQCAEPLEHPGVDDPLQVGELLVAVDGLQDGFQEKAVAPVVIVTVTDFCQGDL